MQAVRIGTSLTVSAKFNMYAHLHVSLQRSLEEEQEMLIYNHVPIYTGKVRPEHALSPVGLKCSGSAYVCHITVHARVCGVFAGQQDTPRDRVRLRPGLFLRAVPTSSILFAMMAVAQGVLS